ncbi:MAG: hypothetical protein IJH48_05290 [Oscillospiraceae bacterium]|nr:hypothetical protein [Oscillospiraceae bacterium]
MKKILCVMLCLGVVFSLCSCAGLDTIRNAEIPPLPTREATAAPDEPAPENTASPEQGSGGEENTQPEASAGAELGDRVIIYTKKTQEDYGAPDGSIILLFSYVTPKVRIDERPAAAEKINEQLNLLEEAYISGTGNAGGRNHLLESATDNYNYIHDTGASLNTLFTSARTVKGTRADGSVVSFRFWTSVYTGGTGGSYGYYGINFDAETGDKLSLDSLSADPEGFKQKLIDSVIALARKDSAFYSQLSQNGSDADGALAAIVREGSWYFSPEGIVFFPAFGELRPEDEGLTMFTVPYSALAGVMDERFFPVKRDGTGTFEIVRVGEVTDGTVASIDRLVVSDGEEMYLKVKGTIYDLTISSFYYVDQAQGDERFYETDRHWYASYMSDCALQICAVVPNGMPDLMISYTDADYVQHRLFLSESGVNGGITLVDDTIKAVG